MIFDTLSAPNLTQLAELWYEQDFYKDTIRVKLGKIDAIENFAFTQSANLMLNSGYETFPNLLGFPTYPNPATGVILVVHPIKYFKLSGALFDGSLIQGFPTGRLGPKRFFNGLGSHAFIISEANILWGKDYKGVIKLGGWGNTASIKRLNNSSQNGTGGGYVIFEQILFQGLDNVKNRLCFFSQYSFANKHVSKASDYFAFGMQLKNLISKNISDSLNVGVATSLFSKGANVKPYEMSIEATYSNFFIPWMNIQPDIQYIVHPNGRYRDCLVATLRLGFRI